MNFVVGKGLATVTGVCTNVYNCVIGEMGVVNQNGQPYPSTGFTSVYVMAHEIGHKLVDFNDFAINPPPPDFPSLIHFDLSIVWACRTTARETPAR